MKKELGQSELPVSRKVPKTTQKCYFWRLSNFEQFLGLFSNLVAAIDLILVSLVLYFSSLAIFGVLGLCRGVG